MPRTLRAGDAGPEVRALQDVLNFHIRRLAPLTVDGRFGPQTKARVLEFQKVNGLGTDGVVGHNTNNKLFESELQQFSLSLTPTGSTQKTSGLQPPRLIPPLTLPSTPTPRPSSGPLIPVPQLTLLQLPPASTIVVPALGGGQLLTLSLTVPTRNDPVDPALKSFRQIVQVLQTLPANFPFKATLIGAVPNPVKVIGDISSGFQWGVDPVFDLKKLAGPTEFAAGASANASYTINVLRGTGPSGMKLGIFAKGDFKGTIDYTSERATSTPLFQMEGAFSLGAEGRF
jgi:peptidoglycan hydrolase-like protein with peptidoglycan-binding domain